MSYHGRVSLPKRTGSLLSTSGMSTSIDTPRSAGFLDGFIFVVLQSGGELRFPASENLRLAHATPAQLNNIELSPFGLHWPDLDEDLSIRGIAQGDYGQGRKS